MASSTQTTDDNADSQSTERRLIDADDCSTDNASNGDISEEEWDDDEDANRRYDSGPGKLFQEQIDHGNVDHPQLKITNIPVGCGSPAVRRECEACGALESFKLVAGKREGAPAHAFVEFKVSQSLPHILKLVQSNNQSARHHKRRPFLHPSHLHRPPPQRPKLWSISILFLWESGQSRRRQKSKRPKRRKSEDKLASCCAVAATKTSVITRAISAAFSAVFAVGKRRTSKFVAASDAKRPLTVRRLVRRKTGLCTNSVATEYSRK